MPHAVEIGRLVEGGKPLLLDVPRLVATRLLVQGRSGGGKSWTLRRILEQTHGSIQHLVLDPEGEFASLRERYDYVLAGKGGDIAADPSTAALLAHRLLELRVSAVLDLYELKAADRRRFVRLFLEALVNAPKNLWHPALVVLDEAHMFCPEKGEAESANAVIELCQRGRKRGFAAVLATQRLSNLSKQAAAQCANVLVGPTFLDVDRKRACEMLGVSSDRKLLAELMALKAGQFWAVGAAFTPGALSLVQIGPVRTHHPEIAGGKAVQPGPPPAPEKVRAVLSKLADLPREVADEANERETLRTRVAELQREVKRFERETAQRPVQQVGISEVELARQIEQRDREWRQKFTEALAILAPIQKTLKTVQSHCLSISRAVGELPAELPQIMAPEPWQAQRRPEAPAVTPRPALPRPVMERQRAASPGSGNRHGIAIHSESGDALVAGERKMLEVLWRSHPAVLTVSQWGLLAGYAIKGGTFQAYARHLKREGLVEVNGREVTMTDAGRALCPPVPDPMTPEETLEMWRGALVLGERTMLDVLVAHHGGLSREELGEQSGYSMSGGTGQAYLRKLKRNGLAVESGGLVRLAEELR